MTIKQIIDEQNKTLSALKTLMNDLNEIYKSWETQTRNLEIGDYKAVTGNENPTYDELKQAGIYPNLKERPEGDIPHDEDKEMRRMDREMKRMDAEDIKKEILTD